MPHDVFVSYAHADDEPPARAQEGWVSTFVEELKKLLHWKLGGDADVWKDYQLALNERVEETLVERVRDSKTIVLFMSQGYLASKWCQLEIDEFLSTHRPERKESVFVIAVDETDRARWPERVRELTPLELFSKSKAGIVERLGFPNPPADSGLYWTRLNELAHFLCQRIRAPGSPDSQGKPPHRADGDPSALSVWIAQPTPDLQEQWECLASAIRQHGATVRPVGHSTYVVNDFAALRDAAERDMTASTLLIQLLSAEPGIKLSAGSASASSIQASAAYLYGQTHGTSSLKWRSSDVNLDAIADVEHRELLRGAIASGFEAFRQQVLDILIQASRPAPRPSATSGSDGSLSLCVTAGPKDTDLSDAVASVIESMGHAAVAVPPSPQGEQTQATYREQIEALLCEVNGVIVVHGKEDGLWVTSRHFQVRKILAPKRNGLWGAYLNGPPPNKARVRIADPGVMALDCSEGVKPEPIRDVIQALGGQ